MQFPTDRLLLLRGGIPPIVGTKIFYYKSRFFKNRALPPPVVSQLAKQTLVALAPTPFRHMTDDEAEGHPTYPLTPDDNRTEDYPSFCADLLPSGRHDTASLLTESGDENG